MTWTWTVSTRCGRSPPPRGPTPGWSVIEPEGPAAARAIAALGLDSVHAARRSQKLAQLQQIQDAGPHRQSPRRPRRGEREAPGDQREQIVAVDGEPDLGLRIVAVGQVLDPGAMP